MFLSFCSNIPYCTSFWAFPRQVPDIFPEPLLITNSSKEAIPTTCASETATTATVAVTNGSEREQESVEEPDMKPERQCLISDSSMFADLPSGQQIKYTRQTAATLHGQMVGFVQVMLSIIEKDCCLCALAFKFQLYNL